MDGLKWYDKCMRIAALQCSQGEYTFRIPEIINKAGFNVEQLLHVVGEGVMGLYDEARDSSNLDSYVKMSKELDTRIILYYNAHMMEKATFADNQTWAQRKKDGSTIIAYGSYLLTCVNTEWRNDFILRVEQALRHGIDGVFLDGPMYSGAACYCDDCKKLFLDEYKHGIDQASDIEINDFKVKSIVRFIKDVRDVISKKGEDIILYANSPVMSNNVTGCDVDKIYDYVDFIGTEAGFIFYTDPNQTSIWYGSKTAKYLENKANGKPYVVFADGAHKGWSRYMHNPDESRLLFASAVANGANVWYAINGPVTDADTPGVKAGYEFNKYLEKNEEYYSGTKRYADAALVWSKNTIRSFPDDVTKTDFTDEVKRGGQHEAGSFLKEFEGFNDIMYRAHVQFDIIDEKNIRDDDLNKFKVIVLPNVSCLSREESSRIKEFVQNGGTILATMATAFYDENGIKQDMPLLADVFGIEETGETVLYKDGCSYLQIKKNDWLGKGLQSEMTAGFSKSASCTFNKNAEILASMHIPMEGRYDRVPDVTYPSIANIKYGKGRCIYISGNLGETYANSGVTDIKEMLKNILSEVIDSDITVENAYETIEVQLREQQQNGRKLIHIVNYTGQMRRPIHGIIPCYGIKIRLAVNKKVKRVHALYIGLDLNFREFDNSIEFVIPSVREYECLVVE